MPTARTSGRSRRTPSSTHSRCFRRTAVILFGRPTVTAKFRERRTFSLPTGLRIREPWPSSTTSTNLHQPSTTSAEDGERGSNRVGQGDRRGVAHLDRAAVLSRRSLPHSFGEHGKHAPRR